MTDEKSKKAAPVQDQAEHECCELYGEYCYPCAVPEVPSHQSAKSNKN